MASVEPIGRTAGPRLLTGRLKALLIGSLALNLLVAGMVAGAFWRGSPAAILNATGAGGANLVGYVATLPSERRRDLMSKGQGLRKDMMPLRHDIREARRIVLQTLVAEPFDSQRFNEAQARLLDAEVRQRTALRQVVGDLAAGMTPDERRSFLRWRVSSMVARCRDLHAAKSGRKNFSPLPNFFNTQTATFLPLFLPKLPLFCHFLFKCCSKH